MSFADPKPAAGAKRWDAAETANYFNHAALDASLEFVLQVGPATALAHCHNLIEQLFERLPKDRCIPQARSIARSADRTRASPHAHPKELPRFTTNYVKKMSSSACAKETFACRRISSTPSATSTASFR